MRSIVDSVDANQSIPWETIIQLIEVYKMTEHMEHNWVKEIFTPDELKQYAEFEKELKANTTLEQKEAFENSWHLLVEAVKIIWNKILVQRWVLSWEKDYGLG